MDPKPGSTQRPKDRKTSLVYSEGGHHVPNLTLTESIYDSFSRGLQGHEHLERPQLLSACDPPLSFSPSAPAACSCRSNRGSTGLRCRASMCARYRLHSSVLTTDPWGMPHRWRYHLPRSLIS